MIYLVFSKDTHCLLLPWHHCVDPWTKGVQSECTPTPHCCRAPAGGEGCLRYTHGDGLGFLCAFLNAVKRQQPLGCHLQMTMAIRDALQCCQRSLVTFHRAAKSAEKAKPALVVSCKTGTPAGWFLQPVSLALTTPLCASDNLCPQGSAKQWCRTWVRQV